MRAIKIDVIKKEIYEVDILGDSISINKELDSDGIDMVRISSTEVLYVDDIGLRRKPLFGAFRIEGYPQALPGHGIIVGLNGPQEVSSRMSVFEVKEKVRFVDVSELPAPVITTYSFERAEDLNNFIEDPARFRPKHSKN